MKTAGIIAEYNPFHNGHQYHIEETRKKTGADYIIAVMSGDFVQRGAPAFMDKYERAYCALAGGCDLVLELPVIYSTASAEFFAGGSVNMLDKLGVCDYLSFGSEEGTLELLLCLAELLNTEPEEYRLLLREYLKKGLSYPAAREKALKDYCITHSICHNIDKLSSFLKGSNNILALEYLKTLKKSCSSMIPSTISRKSAAYHDRTLYGNISSASAIRHHILNSHEIPVVSSSVPDATFDYLKRTKDSGFGFPDYNNLTSYLHSALLQDSSLEHYIDWDTELTNRLHQLTWQCMSYTEIADALKSKNVTHSRIYRALLHCILRIDKRAFDLQYKQNPIPYARILGFRKESRPLLRKIKESSSIPLITKPASIKKNIEPADYWIWEKDLSASRLYQSIHYTGYGRRIPSAYERTPVII